MLLSDLRARILADSQIISDEIVSVDSFLNHQLDIELCNQIGLALANQFKSLKPTVVLTVEASGIVPSFLVAQNLNTRMIIARKKKSLVMGDEYISANSFSFTKNEEINLYLNKNYLYPEDRVLIIDDFLANGNVALGLLDLAKQRNATIVGAGFVIEKSYLKGRPLLDEYKDIKTYSLIRIAKINKNSLTLIEEK